MKSNDNIIREHSLWLLQQKKSKAIRKSTHCEWPSNDLTHLTSAASLQGQFKTIGQVSFTLNVARGIAVKICIGESVELFIKLQINLHGSSGTV